jgi:hypothetical protein
MSMSKKDFIAIAAAIADHLAHRGNSQDKQDIIRVVANACGEINPNFDRSRFFDAAGYDTPTVPIFSSQSIATALRRYKEAHPEGLMGDGVLAMAQMVSDAGGNPGELLAFAISNQPDPQE